MSTSIETITKEFTETRHMPMYKVIMHNDDKTTMEFVTEILMGTFGKEYEQAYNIMMEIHKTGSGLAGVYAKEHAEFKVEKTHSLARAQKFPLLCTIEPA